MRSATFAHIALVAAVIAGCATPEQQAKHDSSVQAGIRGAISAQFDCGAREVAQIDDGISDAQSVALALSVSCVTEYDNATAALAAGMANDRQRRMLTERRARAQSRVENFLPLVLQYRAAARKAAPRR